MEWMEIRVVVPEDDGTKLLALARETLGFKQLDEDWTVEKREQDNATISYAPAPEPPDRKAGW